MKRFFRNLKTLAMVAMVGVASLAASCSQPYDDTQIKADIADLQTRVEALEVGLKNQLQTVKDLIDAEVAELNGAIGDAMDAIEAVEAKIAILDYEQNADGSWTLTTKGGEEIVVYPQYQENNEGLLTVVKEGNTYYWAQIVDGQAVVLVDADGNRYAAHHATVVPEVEHPECEYVEPQVVKEEEGGYKVSFDGGKTWYPLGGGDVTVEASCLFEDVYISEDGKTLSLTINGGQTFTTTLPEEFAFSVKSGKQFFTAGESKEVSLELQAVQDCEVIAKPEGWKASVNGKKLTIVAPAEGGDESGVVKVLAITNDNRAAFGKLNVSTGAGYSISVETVDDPVEGEMKMVVVENYLHGMVDMGFEGSYDLFTPLFFGIMPKSEFSVDAIVNGGIGSMWGATYPYYAYQMERNMYVEGEQTSLEMKVPFDYFWCDQWQEEYFEIVAGEEYILWVTAYEPGANYMAPATINADDIVYIEYCEKSVDFKVVNTSAFDININVAALGYDKYLVYLNELQYAEYWEDELFAYWQKYGEDFGFERTDKTFSGSLFDFGYNENGYSEKLTGLPNKEYLLLILPLEDGKQPAEYTVDDVQDYILKTGNVEAGGSITPTITAAEIGYSNVKAQFEAEGAKLLYYNYYRAAKWLNDTDNMETWTPEQHLTALIDNGYVAAKSTATLNCSGNVGENFHFAAVAVDANGKYGDVVVVDFTAKTVEFSDVISVTATYELSNANKDVTLTFASTGNEAVKYRYAVISNESTWNNAYGGTVEDAALYMITSGQNYYYKDTTNTVVTQTGLSYGSKYRVVVIAYDAEGNISHPYGIEFTPEMAGEILLIGDEGYEEGKPTIVFESLECTYENELYPAYNYYTLKGKITPGEGAVATYIHEMDEESEGAYASAWSFIQYMIQQVGQYYNTTTEVLEEGVYTFVDDSFINNTTCLYVSWKTVKDGVEYYHECEKIYLRDFAGLEPQPEEEW